MQLNLRIQRYLKTLDFTLQRLSRVAVTIVSQERHSPVAGCHVTISVDDCAVSKE